MILVQVFGTLLKNNKVSISIDRIYKNYKFFLFISNHLWMKEKKIWKIVLCLFKKQFLLQAYTYFFILQIIPLHKFFQISLKVTKILSKNSNLYQSQLIKWKQTSKLLLFNTNNFMFSLMSLHELAMFSAVSILSPVSTHTFMLAFNNISIVSGTPSCNLSSMAVAPRRYKF